eukprot:SAG31_NODE_2866_length_4979_cov_3.027869_4_plen_115_part_00
MLFQVASYKNLKLLDLSNNSIVALDPQILGLSALENLNLSGNKLKELPKVSDVAYQSAFKLRRITYHLSEYVAGWRRYHCQPDKPRNSQLEQEQIQATHIRDIKARQPDRVGPE